MKNQRTFQQKSTFSHMDWSILLIYLLLVFIGITTIYSTAYTSEHHTTLNLLDNKYGKQIMWFSISAFLGFLIFLIDISIYQKFAYFIYGFCFILLIAVLFTPPINGAKAWLGIGGMGIQPAEFAKIGTALALAKFIPTLNLRTQSISDILKVNLILIAPIVLILLQPDAGSVVVFTSFWFVLYREGISYDPFIIQFLHFLGFRNFKQTWVGNHFIPLLFIIIVLSVITLLVNENTITFNAFPSVELPGVYGIIFLFVILFFLLTIVVFAFVNKRIRSKYIFILFFCLTIASTVVYGVSKGFESLAGHQKERIELFLGLREDPNGDDYNRNRAMAAVGSGGLKGKGYLQASLSTTEANHVPESETDFIFCPLAEEWGFFGVTAVILLYVILLLRIVKIAERQRTSFNRLYAYCVAMILFYHFAINIGMDIGLAPVIGIPLPFISYGGSSMMSFSVMLFVLMKLDSQRMDVL